MVVRKHCLPLRGFLLSGGFPVFLWSQMERGGSFTWLPSSHISGQTPSPSSFTLSAGLSYLSSARASVSLSYLDSQAKKQAQPGDWPRCCTWNNVAPVPFAVMGEATSHWYKVGINYTCLLASFSSQPVSAVW